MGIEEIKVGETYYTPSIVYFPVPVKILKVLSERIETDKGYLTPDRLYRTEKECPQR